MRLNPDAPVYRAWAAAADLVLVNMLTLVACAPVVTAGAALVACTRSVMEMARDEGGSVARTWWRTFRSELKASLVWWPPFPALGALGVWERTVLSGSAASPTVGDALTALSAFGGLMLLAVLLWLLPLIALFDAPATQHLRNAARLALGRLGTTALCLVLVIAPVVLAALLPGAVGAVVWFLVILGIAFIAYLIALVQRRTIDELRRNARAAV